MKRSLFSSKKKSSIAPKELYYDKNSSRPFLVEMTFNFVNPLSANPTNWPNTFKQFVDEL